MIRRLLFVVLFACAHVAMTVWATMSALGAVMAGFDSGEIESPGVAAFYSLLAEVMISPLGTIDRLQVPGVWGYAVLFANGVLWAVAILVGWRVLGGSREQRPAS